MGLKRISEPATSPVSLAEAKVYIRETGSSNDTGIQALVDAATSFVEDYIGRSLVTQTWLLTLDGFSDGIVLPRGPVASVSTVQYYDTAGDIQTYSSANYTLDDQTDPAFLVRNSSASWPSVLDGINAVKITYVTGYATIPQAIKHAILIIVSDWYDNREGERNVPIAAMSLLENHRAFA